MNAAQLTLPPEKSDPDPVDETMMLFEKLPVGLAALILWIVLLRLEDDKGTSPVVRLWLLMLIEHVLRQGNGWAA